MESSEAIAKMRLLLGSKASTLEDTAIIRFLQMGLIELSQIKPLYAYVNLDLVAGQDTYTLSESVIKVKDFWCSYGSAPAVPYLEGISAQTNPSLSLIYEQQLDKVRTTMATDWEFNEDSNVLRVMPPPVMDGKAVLRCTNARTLSTTPTKFLEGLCYLAIANLIEAQDLDAATFDQIDGAGKVVTMPIGIGSVVFENRNGTKFSTLMQKAQVYRDRGISLLGVRGGGVVIG